MRGAASRCIKAINSSLRIWEQAISREKPMTQVRLRQNDWTLEWTKKNVHYDIQIGKMVHKLRAVREQLANCLDEKETLNPDAELIKLAVAYVSSRKIT